MRFDSTEKTQTLPKVCVCIPNFNNFKTLPYTLDSLAKQTYPELIIKVIDNCSDDGSIKLLKDYERKYDNIVVHYYKEHVSAEDNINRCIENMEGEYSSIYHSDDIYEPTMVEEQVNAMENNGFSAVFTTARFIDTEGTIFGESVLPKEIEDEGNITVLSFDELLKINMKVGNILMCPTQFSRTEYFKNVICSWDNSVYKSATDVEAWLRFANFKPIGLIQKRLINYRFSDNSFSFRRLKKRVAPLDVFIVIDEYIKKFGEKVKLKGDDYRNYDFLKFRDSVVVERNCVINGIVQPRSLNIFDWSLLAMSVKTKSNLFVFLAGLVLTIINYKSLSARLVKLFLR